MANLDLFDLTNSICLITGGYGHLGRAMTLALLNYNATVIVTGRNQQKYDLSFDKETKQRISFIPSDVSNNDSVRNLFDKIHNEFGRIDVLVNNAASVNGGGKSLVNEDEWNETMNGVLGSIYRCITEGLHLIKQSKNAKIVNIASMYGVISPDFQLYDGVEKFTNPPHYGAAKAGVIQLTKYFASLLGPFNIQVNCISPGPFPSENIQKESPEFIKRLSEKTMLKRPGKPEDLSGVLILLSSSASNYITGQNFIVDGGWTSL